RAQENAQQAAEKEREALLQRDAAQTANQKLLAAQEQLRGTLYAAHMNLAQIAWDADNLGRVLELLSSEVPTSGQADLRGFEWYYWQRLCHAELSSVKLEGAGLEAFNLWGMALSPDGTRLAAAVPPQSGDGNFQVKVWDTATGKELLAIPVPAGTGA